MWWKVNQTNLDAQKYCFDVWARNFANKSVFFKVETCQKAAYIQAYALYHRAHGFQPFAPARDASHVCERVTIKHPVHVSKSLASKKLGIQSNDSIYGHVHKQPPLLA